MKTILVGASVITAFSVAGVVHAQSEAAGVDPPGSEQSGTPDFSVSYVETESPPEEKKTWKDKKWNFTIAPYLMFPFMNGSLTVADQTVDVNLNTGDILKRLRWFLMLYFEAKHPKFSIATDLLYMNLGQGGQLPVSGRSADFKMQQLAAELVVFGQLVEWFELGGGGRVNFVQSGLTAPAGMAPPAQAIDLDFRRTWFDPLIAVRFLVPFKNDHWRLALRADVGGFTLGSTYAWQVYPYGGYNFDGINDKRVFELGVAFRAIGMKYETGSGPDRFVYDMIIWGPQLGFLFHF
jgi:hypothetical protein